MKIRFSFVLLIAFLLTVVSCESENTPSEEQSPPATAVSDQNTSADKLKRGEYMVTVMGCHDCHTPMIMTDQGPAPDPNHHLGGHPKDVVLTPYDEKLIGPYVLFNSTFTAAIGPWGISYSANLTPHETGLGNWTEEQFFRALREGKHKGMANGRPLLPPMPWQNFQQLTDEDLSAVFAYLQSIEPVNNLVPTAVIAPPPGAADAN